MNRLESIATRAPKELDKDKTKIQLLELSQELKELQAVMYAEQKHSLLIVLQGLDASGKDGTVKSVFSGVNPMGCRVHPFKKPTPIEYSHDFLWRIHKHVPPKGMIQIFNRSHYEDILVPTVKNLYAKEVIDRRYNYINSFENLLQENGTVILKFYLHLSQEEQAERFEERLVKPDKRWKYQSNDIRESKLWDKYMVVFEEIFEKCSPEIPWHIIPAD